MQPDLDEEAILESSGTLSHRASITSDIRDETFAVLPHGMSLEGWTEDEKAELDDAVRHMLHSKRSKLKRALRGFGHYLKRRRFPYMADALVSCLTDTLEALGFLVTLYAFLITAFGLIWVLFLMSVNSHGDIAYSCANSPSVAGSVVAAGVHT